MKVVETTPQNEATNVVDNKISIKFDTVSELNFGYNFDVVITDGTVNYSPSLSIVKNIPTIQMPGLEKNKKYFIQIPEGVYKDDNGIYNKAYEFSFTTAP